MAARADRHVLYQESVQAVDAEIDFISDTYNSLRGRSPSVIREDFCGTANSACEFVRRRATNRAIGVDLDQPTLDWGRAHNLAKLRPEARRRVTLLRDNVLSVRCEPVDAVLAMNFSYYCFTDRATMRRYFEHVRESLAPGGLFFLDAYGGSDAFKEMQEKRPINNGRFTYVWDQHSYDPITGSAVCKIHFHFPDGSKIRDAFTYHWRLWTLPELRELLAEAGFARSTVYWEGTDEETGEGDGDFQPRDHGDADFAWIVYIVAEL
ncbi:MAG TPA: SAM-dependent methyltransferase [Phycisphaerales bacterium]|nr:SAM-dependent methyltransferase [Phycisphaerales bacterium]